MVKAKRSSHALTTAERIKAVAHKQMSDHGTAGLSLRSIAREIGVTAPAIYNYYPSINDLITALIVDAFNALAASMQEAMEAASGETVAPAIKAATQAYRAWALQNPIDFQLIYGNPIPGYVAPSELTAPLARKPFLHMFDLFLQGWRSGELKVPTEYAQVPPHIARHLREWRLQTDMDLPDVLVCLLASGWVRLHGLVMLELFQHTGPFIGDTEELFHYEMNAFMTRLGMKYGS